MSPVYPHHVAVSAFMICRGLCTEMLRMCVLYVSFGSKVRLRTFAGRGGGVRHNLHSTKTAPPLVGCVNWSH